MLQRIDHDLVDEGGIVFAALPATHLVEGDGEGNTRSTIRPRRRSGLVKKKKKKKKKESFLALDAERIRRKRMPAEDRQTFLLVSDRLLVGHRSDAHVREVEPGETDSGGLQLGKLFSCQF